MYNYISKQKHFGCKKVAWPRKTAAATKRTDMDCGQGLYAITIHTSWYEKVMQALTFFMTKLEDL